MIPEIPLSLKIAPMLVGMVAAQLFAQLNNPCNSLDYRYAISGYICRTGKVTPDDRRHPYLLPFERAIVENARAFFPYWQRLDHDFELALSQSFRSRLIGGEENEVPVPHLPPGVVRLCDSLGLQKLVVFYMYNDDDHAAGDFVRAQFTHRPDEQSFDEEELYYFASVYDVATKRPVFEWMEDLDDILEQANEISPHAAGTRAAQLAVEKISDSRCVSPEDYTPVRDVKRRHRKYGKALLITGICAAVSLFALPMIIIPLGN